MDAESLAAMRAAISNPASMWESQGQPTQPTQPVQLVQPTQPVQPVQAEGNPYIVNQNVNPVPQPSSSSTMSRTEQMRQQMRQSRGQQPAQATQMQQTGDYQPQGVQQVQMQTQQSAQPVQQPVEQPTTQSNNSANRTVINTTQRPSADKEENEDSKKGFQLTPKSVGIIIGIVVVIAVVFVIISGVPSKNPNDAVEEPADSFEDLEWIIPDQSATNTVTYLTADVEALRAAGYTGTEIENYSSAGVPAKDLIAEAEARRDAYAQETYSKLFDTTSDEFRYYTSQTWLTLPEREDMWDWTQCNGYQVRKNLDYEKIDIHGNQLFIKVYLDDNLHEDWFYLNVTPAEWLALSDYGNVIVNYTYQVHFLQSMDEYGNTLISEDPDNIFIIDASLEIIQ